MHGKSLESVKDFVFWMLTLMIVQSLALRRGFLHRLAFAVFIIGLTTLPYLQVIPGQASIERMKLDRTGSISIANPNDLVAWFGFYCVYFTIAGLETKRAAVRVTSWLAAAGCLYVVGLAVGRGALFASAIAIIVALRRLLKHGFIPVIALLSLGWIMYELEIFKHITVSYAARGMEDTGRLTVWPLAIERFFSSPLVGVGVSHIETRIPSGTLVTPHNNFLFLALASEVVPLVFFLGYWIRAAWGVFGTNSEHMPDAPFRISLFIYAFLIALQLNTSFMFSWMIVILCVVSGAPRRLPWVKRRDTAEHKEHPASLAVVPFR
jgi:hypothetical protein